MTVVKQQPAEGTLAPSRNLYFHAVLEHVIGSADDGVSELEWLGCSIRSKYSNDAYQAFATRGLAPYFFIEGADGAGYILCQPTEQRLVQLRAERGERDFPYTVDISSIH